MRFMQSPDFKRRTERDLSPDYPFGPKAVDTVGSRGRGCRAVVRAVWLDGRRSTHNRGVRLCAATLALRQLRG